MEHEQLGVFEVCGRMVKMFQTAYIVDDSIAIFMTNESDGRPFGKLTTNIWGAGLSESEFCVRTWDDGKYVAIDCMKTGLFEDTGRRVNTGWVEAEVWRFKK